MEPAVEFPQEQATGEILQRSFELYAPGWIDERLQSFVTAERILVGNDDTTLSMTSTRPIECHR